LRSAIFLDSSSNTVRLRESNPKVLAVPPDRGQRFSLSPTAGQSVTRSLAAKVVSSLIPELFMDGRTQDQSKLRRHNNHSKRTGNSRENRTHEKRKCSRHRKSSRSFAREVALRQESVPSGSCLDRRRAVCANARMRRPYCRCRRHCGRGYRDRPSFGRGVSVTGHAGPNFKRPVTQAK
jgi:hypothetical protein